jgi:aspartate racemase
MKKLGLIGGMSWLSTIDYYRLINQRINEKLGGLNYAECMIYSFNFADIKRNNEADDWDGNLAMVTKAALSVKAAGAEAIVLCANTMHLIADRLEQNVQLPVINIATATAEAVRQQGLKKIGLLGTKFTMERTFFRDKLTEKNISILIPNDEERDFIHYTIFEELGKSIFKSETKSFYIDVINRLIDQSAEGIILGCTELPLLLNKDDATVPLFDTTLIHSNAAVEFALG